MLDELPQLSCEKLDDRANKLRKYHVLIEAEGADGIDLPHGTEVCFVWKRLGKVSISTCSEIWEDGACYWDAKCSQVCTMVREAEDTWRPKPSEFLVQTISTDDNGLPISLGEIVATAELDLSPFCLHDLVEEPSEPQRITLQLRPAGTLKLQISSVWLKHWVDGEDDSASETTSGLSFNPPSTASLGADESASVMSLRCYAGEEGLSPSVAPSPQPLVAVNEEESDQNADSSKHSRRAVTHMHTNFRETTTVEEDVNDHENESDADSSRYLTPMPESNNNIIALPSDSVNGAVSRSSQLRLSSTDEGPVGSDVTSDSLGGGLGGGDDEEISDFTALQRRCRRLERERDEARAEYFAEASVAVQRSIEIDTMKRAKEMLMQRLETAERQLMMLMRFDASTDSPKSVSSMGSAGGTKKNRRDSINTAEKGGGDRDGDDAAMEALVCAKVSLAEKEFEIMELQGQLRAKDVHVAALSAHLDAVRSVAETRAVVLSTPASAAATAAAPRSPMRSIWQTPFITPPWSTTTTTPITNTTTTPKSGEKGDESNNKAVVHIMAHAGEY